MCIVSRIRAGLLLWLCAGLFFSSPLSAHPVAQGSLQAQLVNDSLVLNFTVALEQVLVAAQAQSAGGMMDETVLGKHADYLLRHVRVEADGELLSGTALAVPASPKGAPAYRLLYPLPPEVSRVLLSQDLLREIDFAPGNPWEVSYRARVVRDGSLLTEGLFSHNQPLTLDLQAGSVVSSFAWDYLVHGVKHILSGYDHILFVIGLVLAVGSLRELGLIVLIFTLAHSLTMSLAVLDWLRLSPRIVEPVIAFSIVAVSVQNVCRPECSRGKSRYWIAFGFGLFHGLGFAGGLLETVAELPSAQLLTAIASFSGGVELGHLAVVVPVYGVLAAVKTTDAVRPGLAPLVRGLGSQLIGLCGLAYFYFALQTALA
ncbi:HupE/UreJ family protein [Methylomonas sp. HYX-M1]|uniref:HupE/UreJ family protein n=1 Tax=Methylomonas sp. HYX-M1 TaxID=3139307 RepID=UPI00345BDB3D